MAKKCPYCKSAKITLSEEHWVCTECGTVIRPLYVRMRPKQPRPLIERPR